MHLLFSFCLYFMVSCMFTLHVHLYPEWSLLTIFSSQHCRTLETGVGKGRLLSISSISLRPPYDPSLWVFSLILVTVVMIDSLAFPWLWVHQVPSKWFGRSYSTSWGFAIPCFFASSIQTFMYQKMKHFISHWDDLSHPCCSLFWLCFSHISLIVCSMFMLKEQAYLN